MPTDLIFLKSLNNSRTVCSYAESKLELGVCGYKWEQVINLISVFFNFSVNFIFNYVCKLLYDKSNKATVNTKATIVAVTGYKSTKVTSYCRPLFNKQSCGKRKYFESVCNLVIVCRNENNWFK